MANKPDWLNERSAAIPVIKDNHEIKVVLVTTKPKENNNWIFPKGQVELGMTPFDSAAKEAYEEAGVVGRISPILFDEYQHKKWGGNMCIKVYTLEVTEVLQSWPEKTQRNRQLLPLDEAINLVQDAQKQSLIKLKHALQNK